MEETFSQNFKRIFLLTFTRELIINSAKRDITKLQDIIKSKEQKIKEKPIFLQTGGFTRELKETNIPVEQIFEKSIDITPAKKPIATAIKPRLPVRPFKKPLLFIPEQKLPSHLEYLKPVPTAGTEIDLFKLNPLIKDNAVRIIESYQDERVVVNGTMGTKPTSIILSKEDIEEVINKFSELSKIPINEGVYRVVVGNLILSAIISETTGPKIIIKKMMVNQNFSGKEQQKYQILPFQNNNSR